MQKRLPIILLGVCLIAVVALGILMPRRSSSTDPVDELQVHFLDLNGADCALFQTPDGHNVLIDTGDKGSAERISRYLRNSGVSHIDLLMVTSPDEGHAGGIEEIARSFGIAKVIYSGEPDSDRGFARAISGIRERRIDCGEAFQTGVIHVGRNAVVQILWPQPSAATKREPDLQYAPIVVRVAYKGVSFLVVGDIDEMEEGYLLAEHQDLQSTIIKLGNDGGDESTSSEFLQVSQPEYAVVTAGIDVMEGYPSAVVLKRLNAAGVRVYRTQQHGNVRFITDGEHIRVVTDR